MIELEKNEIDKCISDKYDIYNKFKHSQEFIIQSSHVILNLLQTQNIKMKDCKYEYMIDILNTIDNEFQELCQSEFGLVCLHYLLLFLIDCLHFFSVCLQQLAQVLTNWIQIAISDNDLSEIFIKSTDLYVQQIYNLSVRILDPCLSFINKNQNDLSTCIGSIITSHSAVCLKGTDNALLLSTLFSANRYSYIFLSFMESLIDLLDCTSPLINTHYNNSMNLFSLIRKSLYIYQSLELSVSIPYEFKLYDSDTFQLCSTRILNEDVECNGSDISVFLPKNNTNASNKYIDSDLNSADISIIFLKTNKSEAFVIDPCSHKQYKNELQGKSATIMLLNNNLNSTNLTSNVNITFNENENDINDMQCVWYNEITNVWSTHGCDTFIDNGKVTCSCNHLTTFSTIKFLYNDCLDSNEYKNLKYSDMPILSNLIFLVLFLCLFIKITADFILIFDGGLIKRFKKHYKDGAFNGPISVYACTFFELMICIEFHFAFIYELNWDTNKSINYIIIITSLLPLLTFCWMFFGVLKTWIRITHSLSSDTMIVKKIENGMKIFMILFMLFIIIEIILICLKHNYFIYGEIIWCIIMTIFTISYVIYASSALNVIYTSVKAVKSDMIHSKQTDEDTKLLRKLLIISLLLAIYFILKTGLSIYLSLISLNYSFIWRLIDMCIEFLSLSFIHYLYNGGITKSHASGNTTINNMSERSNAIIRKHTKEIKPGAASPSINRYNSNSQAKNAKNIKFRNMNNNKMPNHAPQMRYVSSAFNTEQTTTVTYNTTINTSNKQSSINTNTNTTTNTNTVTPFQSPCLNYIGKRPTMKSRQNTASLSTLPNLSQLELAEIQATHSIFDRIRSQSNSHTPTTEPSLFESPTQVPTTQPTISSSKYPTQYTQTTSPIQTPSNNPTLSTSNLTLNSALSPSKDPTSSPILQPTNIPSISPSTYPTISPINILTGSPSLTPTTQTITPSITRSITPTISSSIPSLYATISPTNNPSISPTIQSIHPSISPSSSPTITSQTPTKTPSITSSISRSNPTLQPTNIPSISPSTYPTISPTNMPFILPTITTTTPTTQPTTTTSQSPTLSSIHPTSSPSKYPTTTPSMTATSQTITPSITPSITPTISTSIPSLYPTKTPANKPSISPTIQSIHPSASPSYTPTYSSSVRTLNKTNISSITPSLSPTKYPTTSPSKTATITSKAPSLSPSKYPTISPTNNPSTSPSITPTTVSLYSTETPSENPTQTPTQSTESPSNVPSLTPTKYPTLSPSDDPLYHLHQIQQQIL